MDIAVIGAGYTGLVAASCFAEMGNTVACIDADQSAVDRLLCGKSGLCEPMIDAMVKRNLQARRLAFTCDFANELAHCDICFIAVGELAESAGMSTESAVLDQVANIATLLKSSAILVIKTTVPAGTADKALELISKLRSDEHHIDVVSNPEFMKVGSAVDDFMSPDRIILGTDSEHSRQMLSRLYQGFARSRDKILYMGRRDAELTKFAATAMLASRISLMNEIALVCEQYGVDVEQVRRGIGADGRIGYSFIYPGCGYGGALFSGDIRHLIEAAEQKGLEPVMLKAVEKRNQAQKMRLFEKIVTRFGDDLNGRTIAVWGLSFKPGVADMEQSSAVTLIDSLLQAGAVVKAYDPVCGEELARDRFSSQIIDKDILQFAEHQYDAALDADALVLVTEWKPFRQPDFVVLKKLLKQPVIFDGRNQYDPDVLADLGFEYSGIGRIVG